MDQELPRPLSPAHHFHVEAPQAGGPRTIIDPPGVQASTSFAPSPCVVVGDDLAQPGPSWLDSSGFPDLTTISTPSMPTFASPAPQTSADPDEEATWRMLLGDSPLPGPSTEEVADFLRDGERRADVNLQLAPYDLQVVNIPETVDFEQQTDTMVTTFGFPDDAGSSGYVNIDVGGGQNLFLGLLPTQLRTW